MSIPHISQPSTAIDKIIDDAERTLLEYGLVINDGVIGDGDIHRTQTIDKSITHKNGWYALHLGSKPWMKYGDHAKWDCPDKGEFWQPVGSDPLSKEERKLVEEEFNKKAEADREFRRNIRVRFPSVWKHARAANPSHRYLLNKKIQDHGTKIIGLHDDILVPYSTNDGIIVALQTISAAGSKSFIFGSKKEGAYFIIGQPKNEIRIVEGFSTGASVFEAGGVATAVAGDADNLVSVAKALREKYPAAKLVVCGDNDAHKRGQLKAEEAAKNVGGSVAVPTEEGQDFNDVYRLKGAQAVIDEISKAELIYGLGPCTFEDLKKLAGSIEWLIDGLVPKVGITLVAAKNRNGKTTIGAGIGAHVAAGHPFIGRRTVQTNVWIVAQDRGGSGVAELCEMAATGIERQLREIPFTPYANTGKSQSREKNTWRADVDGSVSQLLQQLNHHNVGLLIIDCLRSTHKGDENSTAFMSAVMANIQTLVDGRRAVLLIHHHNKEDHPRGAIVIEDASEQILGVKLSKSGNMVTMTTHPHFGAEEVIKIQMKRTSTYIRFVDLSTQSFMNQHSDKVDAIKEFLRQSSDPFCSENKIRKAVTGNATTIRELLTCMVSHTLIDKTKKGYRLKPK